jgi:hypothetical protein
MKTAGSFDKHQIINQSDNPMVFILGYAYSRGAKRHLTGYVKLGENIHFMISTG